MRPHPMRAPGVVTSHSPPRSAAGAAAPRVLSIITRLARGGSERRLFDVVAAVEAHHTVLVGRDSDPGQIERLAQMCEVRVEPALVREVDARADPIALTRFVQAIRAGRHDVVHTHQAKAGLLGRVAARVAGAPLVYHSASMASFGPGYGARESALFAGAERVTAPLVDRYFVVGADLARRLAANGVPPGRLQVVRSSLELRPFLARSPGARAERRAALAIGPGRPVVAFVGALEARKGVVDLPAIVSEATGGAGAVRLVAGDGPLRGAVDEAGRAARGVDVRLLGHVRDVAGTMAAADVLVLPSSAEGLPQVLVQAAACDLPFVSYDVDGAAELLGAGARGAAVPLGDRRAMAAALRHVLRDVDLDVGSSDRPARLGARFWSAWDPATVAAQYRGAYTDDLASRRGGVSPADRPGAPRP